MPKNKGLGGQHYRKGNHQHEHKDKRELVIANTDDYQSYAQVQKKMGDCRFSVVCFLDGKEYIAHVRGKLRKKDWVELGSVVLVSLRDFQVGVCDIIVVYTAEEVSALKKMGEIKENQVKNDFTGLDSKTEGKGGKSDVDFNDKDEDDAVLFGDDEDDNRRFVVPPTTNLNIDDI
jgi:translation initiation factor 1A